MIPALSLGVAPLLMPGAPVLLVIGMGVVGTSFVPGPPPGDIGAAPSDVSTGGFALLAVPLFVLAGDLVDRSGIARRSSDLVHSCLGRPRGGLAMASLGARGLLAAIAGSSAATTAAIGSMLHPETVEGCRGERVSAAAGGTVAIVIPPSIILVVHGFLLAPIPAPIAHGVGVEPARLAVIVLVGAPIGLVAPPRGLGLPVASGVAGVPRVRPSRRATVPLAALVAVRIVAAPAPRLSTAPPRGR